MRIFSTGLLIATLTSVAAYDARSSFALVPQAVRDVVKSEPAQFLRADKAAATGGVECVDPATKAPTICRPDEACSVMTITCIAADDLCTAGDVNAALGTRGKVCITAEACDAPQSLLHEVSANIQSVTC